MSRSWVRAALLGVVVLLAACSLPSVGLWSGAGHADTGLYGLYGHRILQGDLPYRDFYMEFPPGAIPALVVPDAISHAHYAAAFHALQLGCLAGCIALLAWALAGAGVGGRRCARWRATRWRWAWWRCRSSRWRRAAWATR